MNAPERPSRRVPGVAPEPQPDDAAEFVRYCYRRRHSAWPELYDEMCAVAARGSYRGWSYPELAERGIGFSIPELPRLAALAWEVVRDEQDAPTVGETAGATAAR